MRRKIAFFAVAALLAGTALILGFSSAPIFSTLLTDGDYLFNWVTKENTLGSYAPQDLRSLEALGAPEESIRQIAYEGLAELMRDAEEEGLGLRILSAYRSYEQQAQVHAYWTKKYGAAYADRISAESGHSEHQLGTTVDFGLGDPAVDLYQRFGNTPEGQWLAENAWRYGFVLSYPAGAEEETGYIYEPWHYRFAGKAAAAKIREENIIAHEYLARQGQFYAPQDLRGRLVREPNSPDVYYITLNGYKRRVPTPEVFESYGNNRWEDVLVADPSVLAQINRVTLIHLDEDPRVYYLEEDGTKRLIETDKVFKGRGFDWGNIAPVNETEFEAYAEGPPLAD